MPYGERFAHLLAREAVLFAVALADLTRSEARDRWAALIAEKLGMGVGLTAPQWYFSPHRVGGCWCLLDYRGGLRIFTATPTDGSCPATLYVPGLPLNATKGIEALHRTLHAVLGVVP